MIVLSIGAASAQDADDALASDSDDIALGDSEAVSGTVSGGVDVATENPWNTSGELSYDIPSDAKTIKSADVYVNVYSGSAKNTYGANANVTITTANDVAKYNESLWIPDGSSDGVVYTVNDHTTKCYSDYMIHYNVTDLVKGLNGTGLKINVETFKMENKTFDGRIKLIGLVLAYDDGDDDTINYWINDNQIWTNSNTTLTFDTSSMTDVLELSLTNVALSSSEATYKVNGEFLTESPEHKSGNYYQYNKWDITDNFKNGTKTEFTAIGSAGSYGVSYKNVLSVLTAKPGVMEASISSLATERANSGFNIVYPGTFNQITATVKTNKNGKYTIQLLADGEVVNETTAALTEGSVLVKVIDPTIRPIDEKTVYVAGANFTNVNYTVKLLLKDELVNESAPLKATVLYNGYFAKDLSYPGQDYASFLNATVTGGFEYMVTGAYASGTANRVDTWNVTLPANSTITQAFVYAAYCYGGADTIDLFNVTFNGVKPSAVAFKRDQANIVSTSGYGIIVYDVTDLIKAGENTFVLNKTHSTGAYPSTLIYMYNTTGSNVVKNVYIYNGADIIGATGNAAGRNITLNTVLNVDASVADKATAYIFGAGSKTGRATITVNGVENATAWDTEVDSTINVYTTDISKTVKDANDVSIALNNNMFTALEQVIVTETVINPSASVSSIKTERANSGFDIVYPGTYNEITVTVNTDKHGAYTVNLLADGKVIATKEVDLKVGDNPIKIIDPTVRDIDEKTVYVAGANFTKVNYTAELVFDNTTVSEKNLTATVLYNGYFAKDLSYPGQDYDSFLNVTVNGGFEYMVTGTYASGTANRVDVWNVTLPDNSTIVKAFVYAAYCYGGADTIDLFNVTFNGVKPSAVAFKRDQANIVSTSGYGIIVYDVTDLIKAGENTFVLNKTHSTGAYPSTLIYMYNTTGSDAVKNIYIYNGADIIGSTGNAAGRNLTLNTTLKVASNDVAEAIAYIFGAGSKTGRATITINGVENATAWDTEVDSTVNVYKTDITKTLKDANDVSIALNNNMFTALQQIIVTTQKVPTKMAASSSVNVVYNNNKALTVTLTANGEPVKGATITVVFNKATKTIKTNDQGKATYTVTANAVPKTYTVSFTYAGDDTHVKSSASTKVVVKKATPKMTAKAKSFKVKTKTKKYTITLKNNKNKVMKNKKVTIKVNKKTYTAKTNSKGKATFKITKLNKRGKFTATVKYAGDKYYNKVTKKVKITVKK